MVALYFLFQDQLSADMYSFVAKEIDYANYFQTVSIYYPYFLQIKYLIPCWHRLQLTLYIIHNSFIHHVVCYNLFSFHS